MSDVIDLLVYSADAALRREVIAAVGARPGKGLGQARWTEAATAAGAQDKIHHGNFSAIVLDAETTKVSGMVLAKTLEQEEEAVPPIVMIVARPQDHWLAEWAGADCIVDQPLDPRGLQEAVASLL